MDKKHIPSQGNLTVDNAFKVLETFIRSNIDKSVCCMTSRKDVSGEPVLHFIGFCKGIKVCHNDGEKKRFGITLFYSLNKKALYGYENFSSFGNVLHWNHIYRVTYEIQDNKLIIKYFCRGSKTPASFLVLQTL